MHGIVGWVILLAIYLVVKNVCELLSVGNPTLRAIINIVGILAGILLVLGR